MPTNVLLAPVGAGKTEIALTRIAQAISNRPFSRVWVLLATKRQEDAFRQRLAEWDGGRRVYFNVEFFNFYELYSRLLDSAGVPTRRLNDTARFRLLRALLAQLQRAGKLPVYGGIAHTPGFVRIAAEFIYELKQNRVETDLFTGAIQTPKDDELARIYRAYQERLIAEKLVDREGEGWLALDMLAESGFDHIARDVDLLVVDGYDQFTPVQADLLAVLAGRARETLVTLTTVPGREDTVGRRFAQALARVQERHARIGQSVNVQTAPLVSDSRHPDLQHLTAAIFRDSPPHHVGDGVTLIEAPNPAREVGAVLRRVKRLLLVEGARPDDVLVVLRNWERYQPHFVATGRAYGLPLALHYGEPLAYNPAMIALLNLLDLPARDFRRRDLLDVLRSPYFVVPGLGNQQADTLERISLNLLVTGGHEAWLEAVRRAARVSEKAGELDEDAALDLPGLGPEEWEQLGAALREFFEAITPPAEGTVSEYIRWLEILIGPDPVAEPDDEPEQFADAYRLRMLWQVRRPATDKTIVTRDLAALDEFKNVLRGLLAAQGLMTALGDSATLTWDAFLSDLRAAINSASVNPRPSRTGRVLVTTAADGRGLPHDHVFILGLSEGLFPAQLPEDPLYLDSERKRLRESGVFLETQAERAADDGLFFELISLPSRTLTLSRPTVQDGKPWIESHLWRGVMAAFSGLNVERIPVGSVVRADEVASLDEAALSVANGLNNPRDALPDSLQSLYGWVSRQPYWERVRRGRAVEMERLSWRPHNRYSGRLSNEGLIAEVAALLGPEHVWSATQFNEFGSCGFRFFARRLLELEAPEEPEEGLDARELGTINHEILEKTYRHLAQMGATLTPEFSERALAVLRKVAVDVLRDAPRKLGFRVTALWEQEQDVIVRRLEALVRLDFSADSPILKKFGYAIRQPYRVESPFGHSDGPPVTIPLGDDQPPLRVRGTIDRMDRVGDGVVVVDYKSGSTKIPVEEMAQGRNFQMMVYLLAAEATLAAGRALGAPHTVIGGLFWHLRDLNVSGEVSPEHEANDRARQHLAGYIARGRQGDFAAHPNRLSDGRCAHFCEYHQLCRVGSTNRHKREQ